MRGSEGKDDKFELEAVDDRGVFSARPTWSK